MEWANEESTYGIDFLKITVQSSDSIIIGDTRILLEGGRKEEPFYEAINNVLMECAEELLGTVNWNVTIPLHTPPHPQLNWGADN